VELHAKCCKKQTQPQRGSHLALESPGVKQLGVSLGEKGVDGVLGNRHKRLTERNTVRRGVSMVVVVMMVVVLMSLRLHDIADRRESVVSRDEEAVRSAFGVANDGNNDVNHG
jgi:hypothetical protein